MDDSHLYDPIFYQKENCQKPSQLFEAQTDSFYFAKDLNGKFVFVNRLLLDYFHMKSGHEIIGKTDFEILRDDLAKKYRIDDESVIKTEAAIRNKLEIVDDGTGNVNWFVTTKAPLRNINNDIVGIEGITRDVRLTKDSIEPYSEFRLCIDFLQQNYMKPLQVKDLAMRCSMSLSTFERKFKRHFGNSPSQYIKRLRIEKSCEILKQGQSIQEAAFETGFCDQSYFTKEFRLVMGITPRQYKVKLESSQISEFIQ